MRRSRMTMLAAAGVGLAAQVLLGAGAAGAATDTTPPVLRLPAYAGFVTGTQVDDSTDPDGWHPETSGITQQVRWSATDASGICGYDVERVYAGQEPAQVVSQSMATRYVDKTTDYADQMGGGSFKVTGWSVTAQDCAGNRTTGSVIVLPVATQEDGWTYGYRGVDIGFTGTWTRAACSCALGDATQSTTQPYATAVISRSFAAGERLALVMAKGPARGRADVLVDGVYRTTIDTYAAAATPRSIVWASPVPGAGVHVVTVVNRATAGRPRIELDAVISN